MKVLLFLLFFSNSIVLFGQVVSAPGVESLILKTNAQILNTNNNLAAIKAKIGAMEGTLDGTLQEIEEETQKTREIKEAEEDALWKVPAYLKNGNEINSIFDKEVYIVVAINDIFSLINGSNHFQTPDTLINSLNAYLNQTGAMVDQAVFLCTDDMFRLPVEERTKLLREIEENVSGTKTALNILKSELDVYIRKRARQQSVQDGLQDAINRGIRVENN